MKRKRDIASLAEEYYKNYEVLRYLSPEVFSPARARARAAGIPGRASAGL